MRSPPGRAGPDLEPARRVRRCLRTRGAVMWSKNRGLTVWVALQVLLGCTGIADRDDAFIQDQSALRYNADRVAVTELSVTPNGASVDGQFTVRTRREMRFQYLQLVVRDERQAN